MKRYILFSILLFFISTISYACENFSITIKCDRETIYKYWLWKELSSQYGDSHFKSFLNHKIAYGLRTYFNPKPPTIFLQDLKPGTKFFSLELAMRKKALINTKKLIQEKNTSELGNLGYSEGHMWCGSSSYRMSEIIDERKSWEKVNAAFLAIVKEDSSSGIDSAPWDDID